MKSVKLLLNSIESVKEFVSLISAENLNAVLISDIYTVDAKSILGIFSLDLSSPLELRINGGDASPEFLKAIDKYSVK
jgi:phosphotransferase system HPr-like phosphotransfer protein